MNIKYDSKMATIIEDKILSFIEANKVQKQRAIVSTNIQAKVQEKSLLKAA